MQVLIILFVILEYFHETFRVKFWTKDATCGNKTKGKPFYFGTTNIECMTKVRMRRKKRSFVQYKIPERKFWSLNHRWIYYDGWYFELFYRPHTRKPAKAQWCSIKREATPAGYSLLHVDCMRKCAKYYNNRFSAKYDVWTHNCHHYANKIAEMLCTYSVCPDWCDELVHDPVAVNNSSNSTETLEFRYNLTFSNETLHSSKNYSFH